MRRFLQHQSNNLDFDIGVEATGTPTVTITDGGGTALVTDAATANPSSGVYRYALTPAQTAVLDTYTAVLTAEVDGETHLYTQQYEVAGGVYFTVAELQASMAGTTTLSDEDIIGARERIEALIEQRHNRAYVPRGRRVTLDGDNTYELILPDLRVRSIYSISVTDSAGTATAFTADELADVRITSYGFIRRKSLGYWTGGYGNISVHYVIGEAQVPDPIKRAALLMCQARFNLVDAEGNQQGHEQILLDVPEVKQLLEGYEDHYVGVA